MNAYFVGKQGRRIDTRSNSFAIICNRAYDVFVETGELPYIGVSKETVFGGELLYKCYFPNPCEYEMDLIHLYGVYAKEAELLCLAYSYGELKQKISVLDSVEINYLNNLAGIRLEIGLHGERITKMFFNKSVAGLSFPHFHHVERGFAFHEPRAIGRLATINWTKEGF